MPAGLDTVVPQEFTKSDGNTLRIPAGAVKRGDNRRLAGEDLARGSAALRAGRMLRPADLGLLASLGRAEVPVFRKLRVAFFSTGDELRSIGEPLDTGCVYDSNRYTIWAMLQRLGCEVIDLGVVRDQPAALRIAFSEAAACADAVITCGSRERPHRADRAELGDAVLAHAMRLAAE
jgi:molybdopterin molybdotransferase